MNRFFLILSAFLVLLSSCKGGGGEQGGGGQGGTATSLAQLLEKSTSTSAEFDIVVKDLVVTAVYENYAQLEDESAGAQLNKSGHGLSVGQKFNGRITGKARKVSGALSLSLLNTSAATVSTASVLPCTVVSLAEVKNDPDRYSNRRIKLENATFVNGFSGAAGGAGSFSQSGVQIAAVCRPAGVIVADGWQGDIYCYATSSACYVFDAADLSQHEINTPLKALSAFGVFGQASSAPSALRPYRKGKDQYAWSTDASSREFRLQNYSEEWFLQFRFPKNFKLGEGIELSTQSIGVDALPDGTSTVFVEKIENDKVWLMDYANDRGYVLCMED